MIGANAVFLAVVALKLAPVPIHHRQMVGQIVSGPLLKHAILNLVEAVETVAVIVSAVTVLLRAGSNVTQVLIMALVPETVAIPAQSILAVLPHLLHPQAVEVIVVTGLLM